VSPWRRPSPRALTADEQRTVLARLHEPRFVDLAPAEVYATLLDEGAYLCSERTMYRLLARRAEVRERRDQLRHPRFAAPSCWPAGPTSCGAGTSRSCWARLSRYVVGWMVTHGESATLAERFIHETCARQCIGRDHLTIHADRGSAMTSKSVAFLLADLGVTKTHSRPHVSNDNPYSEAHFKTLKYRPAFPDRFGSLQDARAHGQSFFTWYNTEHHHSGLGLLTPHDVHHGLAEQRVAVRATVLAAAYAAHSERFPGGLPQPPACPTEVWINPPSAPVRSHTPSSTQPAHLPSGASSPSLSSIAAPS
jgi:putative transposase